jgi:hypothetical protein
MLKIAYELGKQLAVKEFRKVAGRREVARYLAKPALSGAAIGATLGGAGGALSDNSTLMRGAGTGALVGSSISLSSRLLGDLFATTTRKLLGESVAIAELEKQAIRAIKNGDAGEFKRLSKLIRDDASSGTPARMGLLGAGVGSIVGGLGASSLFD